MKSPKQDRSPEYGPLPVVLLVSLAFMTGSLVRPLLRADPHQHSVQERTPGT